MVANDEYDVLFLVLASCLSDRQVATLRRFVEAGGTLVVDGRAGLLTGDGAIRERRPLDALMGVRSPAGISAVKTLDVSAEARIKGSLSGVPVEADKISMQVLEPGLVATAGRALGEAGDSSVLVVRDSGKGRCVTLNFALAGMYDIRAKEEPKALLGVLDAVIRAAGVASPCELRRADGSRPLCTEQVLFTDGRLRYLAIEQDLLLRHLPDQEVRLKLPEASIVYDVRAGKRLGDGRIAEWDVVLSRGRPWVYALMPYAVSDLAVNAPGSAKAGDTVTVSVAIGTADPQPGYHVVRLNVYAPGSKIPHRQYSQNIGCNAGRGKASIPFALSDRSGEWSLELRDVATGVKAARTLVLSK